MVWRMAERKALLNYTTEIAVEKSMSEIQGMLAKSGAQSISTAYTLGMPTRITFLIETAYGIQGYTLPANIDAVFVVMQKQSKAGKIPPRFVSKEQAARVGWRIIKDWLEAQLAIIETEMVTMDQVMFPYLLDNNDRSVYELWVDHRLALPSGEGGGDGN